MRLLLFIVFVSMHFYGFCQSALFMQNGVSISIPTNSTLTVKGDLSASDVADTSSLSVNGRLELTGDWDNSGTGKLVDLSEGLVLFNGSSSQSINGNTAFNNLEINNAFGVSIVSGSILLNNELTLSLGNLNTNGFLTLKSNASKTARIAPILTGSISGDVTIEAFIENEAYDYRFLTIPVQNKTIDEWSDDFLMTGFTGTPFPNFSFVSVFYYDETEPGDRNARYDSATNITNTIPMGKGAQAYLGASDIIVDVTGAIYSGLVNFPVTYTADPTQGVEENGWNLLGNPYPSTIDWNSGAWTKVNMNNAIYVYEGSIDAYQSYINGVGTNGGTQYIPSTQAFWVKANGTPTLTGTEDVKTDHEIGYIENNQDVLRLSLSSLQNSDEVVIRFNQMASSHFDASWDAHKFKSNAGIPQLTAIQDSIEYSILTANEDSLSIPIYLKAEVPVSGTYKINVGSLPSNANCIYLEDLMTNRIENLRDSASFTFHLYDTTSVPRFKLLISEVADYQISAAACFDDSSSILVSPQLNLPIIFKWKEVNQTNFTNDTIFGVQSYQFANGTYFFESSQDGCIAQYDTFRISSPTPLTSNVFSISDTGFSTGKAWVTVAGGIAPYQFKWNTQPIQFGDTAFGMSAGVYEVKITDDNLCIKRDSVTIMGLVTNLNEFTIPELNIYPNPSQDLLYIVGLKEEMNYQLQDVLGKVVQSGRVIEESSTLNLSHLSTGIYYLRLESKTSFSTLKIQKR